jgi:uncharacterized protein YbaP (TraB family)
MTALDEKQPEGVPAQTLGNQDREQIAAPASRAKPAIWVAHGMHGAKVYLFGTIHIWPRSSQWRVVGLARAWAEARELWLETADDLDRTEAAQSLKQEPHPLMQKYGFDLSHPLSSWLTEDQVSQLDHALRSLGSPHTAATLATVRPWVVEASLLKAMVEREGFATATGGIDGELLRLARQAGKPVKGFETAEEQIRMFASVPPTAHVQGLMRIVSAVAIGSTELHDLWNAWAAGDIAIVCQLTSADWALNAPTNIAS